MENPAHLHIFNIPLIYRTPFMEDGVERIVEQVVNPKIMSVIEPEVRTETFKSTFLQFSRKTKEEI